MGGSDYYTFYKLCIEYIHDDIYDLVEEILEDTKEKHNWYESDTEEEEFDDINDYYDYIEEEKRYQINTALNSYPKVDLFKHRTWICNKSEQNRCMGIIGKHKIQENSIISIWKEGDYKIKNG
jgi:hypothetical protein